MDPVILIVSFNCNKEDLFIYNYEPVLYLFDKEYFNSIKIPYCKYSDYIDHRILEKELVNQIERYYNNFDIILFLNNKNDREIRYEGLLSFKKPIIEKWIINGDKHPSVMKNGVLIPEYYLPDQLFINCNELNKKRISSLKEKKVGKISFPYFSYIIFTDWDLCVTNKSRGLSVQENTNNNFIIV